MAFKSGTERFDEALETLLSLGATRGFEFYNGYKGVLVWLSKQANPVVAKNTVGSQISVGGFFSDKSLLAVEIRRSLRALLLLKITCHNLSRDGVTALKGIYDGARYPHQLIKINSEIKEASRSPRLTSIEPVEISPAVYEYAGGIGFPHTRQTLEDGRNSGNQMLREAHAYMKSPSREKLLYTRWFGDFDATFNGKKNRETVEDNIRKVMGAYATKRMMFTFTRRMGDVIATAAQQSYEEFCKQNYIKVNLAEYFFPGTDSHSDQLFYDAKEYAAYFDRHLKIKAEKNSKFLNIICREMNGYYSSYSEERRKFKEAKAKAKADPDIIKLETEMHENWMLLPLPPWAERERKISVAGVIVHEATHQIVDTTDVSVLMRGEGEEEVVYSSAGGEVMYGADKCYWLARKAPQLAITNADNYRLFCEEFLLTKSLQTT
ncbi:hypothetical protein FAZ69_15725 [Trinickia terrae]|uniref:Lysine-specific metallo-endopeptidase domain-containing protein n=1 Tax=Trinickia terrae TaxID=2571161 RepID=A0A4U1I3D0_9BURK|nr:hypothetical protein [Trinickia terrae]TKC87736.1 hypothetical protein FAZ69_15725 [Trinickia terrae]